MPDWRGKLLSSGEGMVARRSRLKSEGERNETREIITVRTHDGTRFRGRRNQMCSLPSTCMRRRQPLPLEVCPTVEVRGDRLRDIEETILVPNRSGSVSDGDFENVISKGGSLVLVVDLTHESGGWRQDLVDEDEDGLLGRELDPLSDDIHELQTGDTKSIVRVCYARPSRGTERVYLSDGEIGGDEVLLLVDRRDIRLVCLLADDLCEGARSERPSVSDDARGMARSTMRPRPRLALLIDSTEWAGTLTGMRSGYFCLMRSASALRFSVDAHAGAMTTMRLDPERGERRARATYQTRVHP